jgi:hypothetical protein
VNASCRSWRREISRGQPPPGAGVAHWRAILKRITLSTDIATLALTLCSPAARNLSGQCIAVTAGDPAV